jgi:hypothetical protein
MKRKLSVIEEIDLETIETIEKGSEKIISDINKILKDLELLIYSLHK